MPIIERDCRQQTATESALMVVDHLINERYGDVADIVLNWRAMRELTAVGSERLARLMALGLIDDFAGPVSVPSLEKLLSMRNDLLRELVDF